VWPDLESASGLDQGFSAPAEVGAGYLDVSLDMGKDRRGCDGCDGFGGEAQLTGWRVFCQAAGRNEISDEGAR
jgi:hypothetical protein